MIDELKLCWLLKKRNNFAFRLKINTIGGPNQSRDLIISKLAEVRRDSWMITLEGVGVRGLT